MSDRPAALTAHTPEDQRAFRALARRWAATVTVVTGRDGAALGGFTATAFLTVSIDPPIVLVSAAASTSAGALARACEAFTVNILSDSQRAVAERFAMPAESRADAFEKTPHELDPGGGAVLLGALGAFSARVRSRVDAGDHVLLLGDVSRIWLHPEPDAPLLYVDRAFRRVGEGL